MLKSDWRSRGSTAASPPDAERTAMPWGWRNLGARIAGEAVAQYA